MLLRLDSFPLNRLEWTHTYNWCPVRPTMPPVSYDSACAMSTRLPCYSRDCKRCIEMASDCHVFSYEFLNGRCKGTKSFGKVKMKKKKKKKKTQKIFSWSWISKNLSFSLFSSHGKCHLYLRGNKDLTMKIMMTMINRRCFHIMNCHLLQIDRARIVFFFQLLLVFYFCCAVFPAIDCVFFFFN